MAQKARPNQDVLTGSWAPTPLFQRLKERVPDQVAVSSADDPAGDTFEVMLKRMAWPKVRDAGTHRLTVRLKKTGPDAAYATIALLQGSLVIAAKEVQPADSYQDEVLELTAAQVAQISNYADLRLRVTAGRITVPCCPAGLPAVLHATVSNKTDQCVCMPDSVTLVYEGSGSWKGGYTGCLNTGCYMLLGCDGAGNWTFGVASCGVGTLVSASCDPLAVVFDVQVDIDCTGTYRLTITE